MRELKVAILFAFWWCVAGCIAGSVHTAAATLDFRKAAAQTAEEHACSSGTGFWDLLGVESPELGDGSRCDMIQVFFTDIAKYLSRIIHQEIVITPQLALLGIDGEDTGNVKDVYDKYSRKKALVRGLFGTPVDLSLVLLCALLLLAAETEGKGDAGRERALSGALLLMVKLGPISLLHMHLL
ncbi:hypothetical protein NDU88_000313 [Pleurodeles waltl]|uniref:Uncharacterized protein n=1 Tax=Pleurodeles waltl TaxID=8319 RepID=A0AAV7VT46_PLEWA|nr:hypothetical protein NDU88_000313 [Pleurodeles waltl]